MSLQEKVFDKDELNQWEKKPMESLTVDETAHKQNTSQKEGRWRQQQHKPLYFDG